MTSETKNVITFIIDKKIFLLIRKQNFFIDYKRFRICCSISNWYKEQVFLISCKPAIFIKSRAFSFNLWFTNLESIAIFRTKISKQLLLSSIYSILLNSLWRTMIHLGRVSRLHTLDTIAISTRRNVLIMSTSRVVSLRNNYRYRQHGLGTILRIARRFIR